MVERYRNIYNYIPEPESVADFGTNLLSTGLEHPERIAFPLVIVGVIATTIIIFFCCILSVYFYNKYKDKDNTNTTNPTNTTTQTVPVSSPTTTNTNTATLAVPSTPTSV